MKDTRLFRARLEMVIGGKSVAAAARMLGLNESAVRNYRSGRSLPGLSHAEKVANAAGVSIDWLAGRSGASRNYGDEHSVISISAASKEATDLIRVPYYYVEAGAGNPKIVEEEEISSWLWISSGWANRFGKSNLSIVKASGDSMAPTIEPGSLVMVNQASKTRDAGIKAVRVDDGLVIKRCEPLPKHAMLLSSDNPSYEAYTARKGDYEIIGAVVAVIKVME